MTAAAVSTTLGALVADCAPELVNVVPRHLVLDSRRVGFGDVFVAVPGRSSDGRMHIESALERGAAAVLAEADGLTANDPRIVPVPGLSLQLPELAKTFYGDPSSRMALVAVTGTNGKTSVVDFVAQLLRGMGIKTGAIGTLGARLDAKVSEAANTTPDVLSINRQLAEWLAQGVDHVAMEASSHALDQGRLNGLSFQTAIFTNLSRDHLDYHVTELAYAEAKLRLFKDFSLKRAIFNADDPVARNVRAVARCASMGISLENTEADVFVQVLSAGPLALRVHTPLGTALVGANLSGSFNAFNVTAAMMAVASLGYAFNDIATAASRLMPVVGRMQAIPNSLGLRIVIDYAHSPDALARALVALRPETQGRLWVVFGCGGDRDRGKRALMGAEAARFADCLVVTSDNPRSEDPQAIIDDVIAGIDSSFEVVVDRGAAIEQALAEASAGDTVLIAGKGHEDYQEIMGVRHPFSDVGVVMAWLSDRNGSVEALSFAGGAQ